MPLQRPTSQLVRRYASDFKSRQAVPEEAIRLLVERFPDNKSREGILLKSVVINTLYSTQIRAIIEVAKHIFELNVDEKIKHGLPEVVDIIAKVTIKGRQRNNYSFASKYCSFHNPTAYPIYDSFVDKLLVEYRKEDKFASFRKKDLKNYVKFKQVLEEFIKFYNLDDVGLKDLDNFLWRYGNERFNKNFSLPKVDIQ